MKKHTNKFETSVCLKTCFYYHNCQIFYSMGYVYDVILAQWNDKFSGTKIQAWHG